MLVSARVPKLLAGLIDDAAVLPPGYARMAETLSRHRDHRDAWYAELVGPLLLPASRLAGAVARVSPDERPSVAVVGDAGPAPAGLGSVRAAVAIANDRLDLSHVEVPVAMRGEDPLPGLCAVLDLAETLKGTLEGGVTFYAEIPLTSGLVASLDHLAEARAGGAPIAPKFRIAGLAAELFPTPVELGALMCACRDRELPFRFAAGAHRAVRRTDPDTGLINHGFLNVLAAVLMAADGAEPVDLAEVLGGTDPLPVVETLRPRLTAERPLWIAFGSSSMTEPLADLRTLGLLLPPFGPDIKP